MHCHHINHNQWQLSFAIQKTHHQHQHLREFLSPFLWKPEKAVSASASKYSRLLSPFLWKSEKTARRSMPRRGFPATSHYKLITINSMVVDILMMNTMIMMVEMLMIQVIWYIKHACIIPYPLPWSKTIKLCSDSYTSWSEFHAVSQAANFCAEQRNWISIHHPSLYLISIFFDQMPVKMFSFFPCVNPIQVSIPSHISQFFSKCWQNNNFTKQWVCWLLYLVLCQWHALFLCKYFFIKVIYLSNACTGQYISCLSASYSVTFTIRFHQD